MATASEKLATKVGGEFRDSVRLILAHFSRAQFQLSELATSSLLSGRLGTLRYRRRQQALIWVILKKLTNETNDSINRLIRDAYRLGSRVAERNLPPLPEQERLSRIDNAAIEALTDGLRGRLDAAQTTIGRRVDDLLRREGLPLAASRLGGQEFESENTRRISNLVEEGITGFVDRAGRHWDLDTYAEMAIRTAVSEAAFEGTQAHMLARGFDLIKISKHVGSCPICKPYEDKIYSLTGQSDVYPQFNITWPIHPQCEHFVYPAPGQEALG